MGRGAGRERRVGLAVVRSGLGWMGDHPAHVDRSGAGSEVCYDDRSVSGWKMWMGTRGRTDVDRRKGAKQGWGLSKVKSDFSLRIASPRRFPLPPKEQRGS